MAECAWSSSDRTYRVRIVEWAPPRTPTKRAEPGFGSSFKGRGACPCCDCAVLNRLWPQPTHPRSGGGSSNAGWFPSDRAAPVAQRGQSARTQVGWFLPPSHPALLVRRSGVARRRDGTPPPPHQTPHWPFAPLIGRLPTALGRQACPSRGRGAEKWLALISDGWTWGNRLSGPVGWG